MADARIFRLGLYEGLVVLPVKTRTAGTYRVNLGAPAGNSLLSTVYVKAASGSVSIKYYDSGPGDGTLPGELIELGGHSTISSAAQSERIIITRISNKPFIEYTVTGTVEFGLHITVVADFPSDPPFLEGDTVDLAMDKGQPIVLYDELAGTWNFARGTGGAFNAVVNEPGTPKLFTFSGVSGGTQNMFTLSPPVGKVWRLLQLSVTCRAETAIKAYDNAAIIGSLRTGAASPNAKFVWSPYTITTALTVDFTQLSGPAVDVEGFIFITEI